MPHACALTQAPWLLAISPQGVGGPRCHFFSTFFANKLYKDTGYNYDQACLVGANSSALRLFQQRAADRTRGVTLRAIAATTLQAWATHCPPSALAHTSCAHLPAVYTPYLPCR